MFGNPHHSINNVWRAIENPSSDMIKKIDPTYLADLKVAHAEFKKDASQFAEDRFSDQALQPPATIWHYSLPKRKRFLGHVPLPLEIGMLETPLVLQQVMYESVATLDQSIGNIAKLASDLPDVNRFLGAVTNENPLSGSNLGIYAHSFFDQRLCTTASPIFTLDDSLYLELCATNIGKQTECHFLALPMPMMYLEFGLTRHANTPMAHNESSGWHIIEGAYLNGFTLTQDELTREIENPNIQLNNVNFSGNNSNIISHALADGFITANGGDVRIIEVLVTGSPLGKDNLLDDSTHQFALVIQDPTMLVSELIEWHIKYNRCELDSQQGLTRNDLSHVHVRQVDVINEQEVKTFEDSVDAITKALLYINSETCITTHIREATEHKKVLKRTINKAKQRKIKNRGRGLVDYIQISLPQNDAVGFLESASDLDEIKGRKATHWRRAYFNTYWTGEGRTEKRIKLIPRTLINPIKGVTKAKDYKVK